MSVEASQPREAASAGAPGPDATPDPAQAGAASGQPESGAAAGLGATLAAGMDAVNALRRMGAAFAALVVAEARLFSASIGVVVIGGIALIAVAVSMWACVVALIGWGLVVATGSIGWALGILVLLHLLLAVGLWLTTRHAIRQASFPATRMELRAVRGALVREAARARDAVVPPSEDAP